MKTPSLVLLSILFIAMSLNAQEKTDSINSKNRPIMKTYLIERDIPNAGQFSQEQLQGISQK